MRVVDERLGARLGFWELKNPKRGGKGSGTFG